MMMWMMMLMMMMLMMLTLILIFLYIQLFLLVSNFTNYLSLSVSTSHTAGTVAPCIENHVGTIYDAYRVDY